jgi:bifunctional non-homologous end joining protein LigD
VIACIEGGKVTLYARNGQVLTNAYPQVTQALAGIKGDVVIDGELAALDDQGVSRFQLLQNALRGKARLRYFVFDLMFLDGEDLRLLPLLERKARPRAILPRHKLLAFSAHRQTYGTRFYKQAEQRGLEGIMGKRADGLYLSGVRSGDWLKIKTAQRQEVVIAGFTAPRRSRPYLGALVIALWEGNGWRYAGHVGTGFTHATLKELHSELWPLRTDASPFAGRVKDEAVTTWVKPKLVAEVKFAEWTEAGEMRHPVYLGLREDKRPEDAVLEKEKPRRRA